jgi:hypothetical protein
MFDILLKPKCNNCNFGMYIFDNESILLTLLLYKFNCVKLANVSPDKESIEDILLQYKINCFNELIFILVKASISFI